MTTKADVISKANEAQKATCQAMIAYLEAVTTDAMQLDMRQLLDYFAGLGNINDALCRLERRGTGKLEDNEKFSEALRAALERAMQRHGRSPLN